MRKPRTTGVGTVGRIDYIEPGNARPYLRVMVHFNTRPSENGEPFRQKVQVRVYSKDLEAIAASIKVGELCEFSGESDAYVEVSNGRHYGNQRVIGMIGPVWAEPVKSRHSGRSAEECE